MKKYFQALLSQTYIQHHHQCQHQYLHQGMFVKAAEDDIETNLHILPNFFSLQFAIYYQQFSLFISSCQPATCQLSRTLLGALILTKGWPQGQSLTESQRTQHRPRRRTVCVSQTNPKSSSSSSAPACFGTIKAAGLKNLAILFSTLFSSSSSLCSS